MSSTRVIKQCLGSKLQTLKMSTGASWVALVCTCYASAFPSPKSMPSQGPICSWKSKEVCDFQLTQACPLPYRTTIKILATMIYWGLPMGPQSFAPTWTLSGLLTDYLYSLSSPLMLSPYISQGGLCEGHLQNGFCTSMPPTLHIQALLHYKMDSLPLHPLLHTQAQLNGFPFYLRWNKNSYQALWWSVSSLFILYSHHMSPHATQSQKIFFHFLEPTCFFFCLDNSPHSSSPS